MNEKLSNLATATLVVCALTVTALAVRKALFSPAPSSAQGRVLEGWEALLDEQPPAREAEVRMVVFTDYTCAYCRRLEHALDSLRAAHGERISVRYRHFPRRDAATAFQAAVASECAAEQRRGPSFHRTLFAHQEALGSIPWDSLATLAALPRSEAFRACVEEQRTAGRVRGDLAQGEALGIAGTPTFVVNGRLYLGARSYVELERLARRTGARR